MGEYLDHLHQVEMEVDIKRKRHLVAIDDDILARVGEVAKQRSVSSEELINTWLRERLL